MPFVFIHVILFVACAAAAYGAGVIVAWRLPPCTLVERIAVRIAAGFVFLFTVLFGLGLCGMLNRTAIEVSAFVFLCAAAADAVWLRRQPRPAFRLSSFHVVAAAMFATCFVLALYPPFAFDETLYHLPTVRRFAETGRLPFVPGVRAPVFPNADEILEVPLYELGGDTATHLLPLLATLITALFVFAVAARIRGNNAGSIAAAVFISSPIVVHLATSGYVEALLTLFITAALFAFERWRTSSMQFWLWWASFFAGAAASVKYLGLFWIGVLVVSVFVSAPRSEKIRATLIAMCGAVVVLLPWYVRIIHFTGNPLFPFAPGIFGHSAWDPVGIPNPGGFIERVTDVIRIPWDTLFARERVNQQPPFSPWFIAAIPLVVMRLRRERIVALLAALCVTWSIIWLELPRDARYLSVVIPLASIALALVGAEVGQRLGGRRMAIVCTVLMLPGFLYAVYRIVRQGPVPVSIVAREQFLTRRVPAYRAVDYVNRVAGPADTTFACGGEELVWYFRGRMIGDHSGLARYDRILNAPTSAELGRRLAAFRAKYVLDVRGRCATRLFGGPGTFRRLYSDDAADVYQLIRPGA